MKHNISILILILLFGCIKPFNPAIESAAENKYVVSGKITDVEGWQEVTVSLSSPIENPEYIPLVDCKVVIHDNKGNVFELEEYVVGKYHVWMGGEYLITGTAYMVSIQTPTGELIESTWDTMPEGPHLDSVYYILEELPTNNPDEVLKGIQFYIDLHAENVECRNYQWEIEYTFEYHAAHPAEFYYDGQHHQIDPPDYSNKICWIDGMVKNVYTLSTKELSQNTFIKFPLHFLDGHTPHLGVLYSVLFRQFAISDDAYFYWDEIRANSHELGGLYEKQPYAIKGNLTNLTNPDNDVLGYFYIASESSRRYFYKDIEGIVLDFSDFCVEYDLGRGGWRQFHYWQYPIYYYFPPEGGMLLLTEECVDCRTLGGKTTKPDFWP